METTSKYGFQYLMKKKEFENDESFYNKCWNITSLNPQSQQEFNKNKKQCQLIQNELDFGCTYSKAQKGKGEKGKSDEDNTLQ